jgi:hypothetical protein
MKNVSRLDLTAKANTIIAICLCLVLGVAALHAQVATVALRVKVSNSFSINGKVYPAGQYEFRHENGSAPVLKMSANGSAVMLKVIERLSTEASSQAGKVVFDKVGDNYFLSEVWIPGKDGFLVGLAPEGNETHVTTKGER